MQAACCQHRRPTPTVRGLHKSCSKEATPLAVHEKCLPALIPSAGTNSGAACWSLLLALQSAGHRLTARARPSVTRIENIGNPVHHSLSGARLLTMAPSVGSLPERWLSYITHAGSRCCVSSFAALTYLTYRSRMPA